MKRRDGLRRLRERLLALRLAEAQLGRRLRLDLDHAVGEAARDKLVEPEAIQAGMLRPDSVQDLFPQAKIDACALRSAHLRLSPRAHWGAQHVPDSILPATLH